MGKVTDIIEGPAADEAARLDELWDATYADLRELARSRLRRSAPDTLLDTTSLVNEAYLRLSAMASAPRYGTRKEFFSYASRVMRSVVVDLARQGAAEVHGGKGERVTLHSGVMHDAPDEDPLRVHEALLALEGMEPRLARVVEMRYFAGLSDPEIAESLDMSVRTVHRDWIKARALLRSMLSDER